MSTVHEETKTHLQAFEFYYNLGPARNQHKVAKRFNVSRWTVSQWAIWFNWTDRLKQREAEIAEATGGIVSPSGIDAIAPSSDLPEVENQSDKDIKEIDPDNKLLIRKAYREVIALAIKKYKEKLLSGRVKVNIGDIERLIKLDFALLGDNMDRLDINVTTDKATMEFNGRESLMDDEEKEKFYHIVAKYAMEEKDGKNRGENQSG